MNSACTRRKRGGNGAGGTSARKKWAKPAHGAQTQLAGQPGRQGGQDAKEGDPTRDTRPEKNANANRPQKDPAPPRKAQPPTSQQPPKSGRTCTARNESSSAIKASVQSSESPRPCLGCSHTGLAPQKLKTRTIMPQHSSVQHRRRREWQRHHRRMRKPGT